LNKTILTIAAIYFIAFGAAVAWEPVSPIPQPEFERRPVLLTEITEEMNVDFAIFWIELRAVWVMSVSLKEPRLY